VGASTTRTAGASTILLPDPHAMARRVTAFPLRVHPSALLMTMPQLLNLWVPHAPHDAWAVQRA